jgi:hypothetical protein
MKATCIRGICQGTSSLSVIAKELCFNIKSDRTCHIITAEKNVGTLGDRLHPLDTGRPAKECNVKSVLRHNEMNDCQGNKTVEHVVYQRLVVVKR